MQQRAGLPFGDADERHLWLRDWSGWRIATVRGARHMVRVSPALQVTLQRIAGARAKLGTRVAHQIAASAGVAR